MDVLNRAISLLGLVMRDKVSGFSGMVSSVCFDAYGCVQAILSPHVDEKGKLEDGRWFDVKRLESDMPAGTEPSRRFPAPDFSGVFGSENGAAEKPAGWRNT